MSRLIFVVNRLHEIKPRQTTAMLIATAVAQGRAPIIAEVDGFTIDDDDNHPFCVNAVSPPDGCQTATAVADFTAGCSSSDTDCSPIVEGDAVFIRTNPGRDEARSSIHDHFLEYASLLERRGIQVCNRPAELRRLASKAALMMLPAIYRPCMVSSCRVEPIVRFVQSRAEATVVKPLVGSRGRDVLRVAPDTPDLPGMLHRVFEGRAIVAQEFIAASPGDQRVVVLDGEPLTADGMIAGIARIPNAGDFRGNLHVGGRPEPLDLTVEQLDAAKCAATLLAEHGVRLAGVDLVGAKVIEFNVFSTGGLFDASRFSGVDYASLVVQRLFSD